MKARPLLAYLLTLFTIAAGHSGHAQEKALPVTIQNFVRAETDLYFGRFVKEKGIGKLGGSGEVTSIDSQNVVRMNRDTIYSSGVFDLNASQVTITLPEAGKRFMSMQVISQDHYTLEVVYNAGPHTYSREKVDTRYVFVLVRMLANPNEAADVKAANDLLKAIKVDQTDVGQWESPQWDQDSQKKIREALEQLNSVKGETSADMFGNRNEVDPALYLIGAAVGWGGNPRSAAVYSSVFPKENDGKTAYTLTVKDVPVDGFWSISVYNATGYFEKNDLDAYSVNNLTGKPNADGSFTIQFGGNASSASNYLPITPGWNYTVRLYRPRKEILDGSWKFPEANPNR